jgi:tetratricopeptide (TPR) repeat protein
MMRDYPVVGGGLYAFAPLSRANYIYDVVRPNLDISHAHNLFLQAGTSLGWSGWLALIGLWMMAMYGLWRTKRTYSAADQWMPRTLTAAAAGYLVFNSFDVLALEQRAGILVWLVLALVSLVTYEALSEKKWLGWVWLVPLALYLALLTTPLFRANLAYLQLDRFRFSGTGQTLSEDLDLRRNGDERRRALLNHYLGDEEKESEYWQSDPDASLFLLRQGQIVYFDNGDLGEAIDWYSHAISLERSNAWAYYWRGIAFKEAGKMNEAISDYHNAVALGSEFSYDGIPLAAMAWERASQIHLELGELDKAIDSLSNAISLAPDVADYRKQLEDVRALRELMK